MFEPLTQADVALIERTFGYPLPDDYATFLRTYGWARFDGEAEAVTSTGKRVPISVLFGRGEEDDSVLGMLAVSPDLHEEGALPIASDRSENLFVLYARKNGAIYYIDHSPDGRAFKVADNFTKLMDAIRVEPYD